MVTREEFVEYLRDGLYHLYDVERLRQNPLTALLGVTDQPNVALALRSILIESIESLKPKDDAPSQSRDWRLHDALFFAYVQQLDQRLVADQLALSVRHLRREQRAALEVLTDKFWQQFDLEANLHEGTATDTTPAQTTLVSPIAIEELTWLKDLPAEKPTDLDQMLSEVLELAQPLIAQHGASVEVDADDALPNLAVHPVALNQILLSVLSVAIPRSASGQVRISARPLQWEVEVQIQNDQSLSGSQIPSNNDAASLEIARQLTNLCGGWLSSPPQDEDAFSVTLALPALEQLPVLAIDDNADTLQLLRRYTAGTRYRLIGTQNPEQALTLAGKLSPQIIVLDVMMPQVDGWKVMGTLRQHPLTSHIPIVVCTILAQESLALSLGASGFVRKPVMRQALLDALNYQIESIEALPERGSY
jgi:CheY-like chemotaxis protein